jgi:predicted secreted protein
LKSAAEMRVNAEKERLAMNDQILQQQGIDEVTKQQMTQAVNQMYTNMYSNYGTMVESANTAFANAMNTANQAKL